MVGLTHSDTACRYQNRDWNRGLTDAEAPASPAHEMPPPASPVTGSCELHSDLKLTGQLRNDLGCRVPR